MSISSFRILLDINYLFISFSRSNIPTEQTEEATNKTFKIPFHKRFSPHTGRQARYDMIRYVKRKFPAYKIFTSTWKPNDIIVLTRANDSRLAGFLIPIFYTVVYYSYPRPILAFSHMSSPLLYLLPSFHFHNVKFDAWF